MRSHFRGVHISKNSQTFDSAEGKGEQTIAEAASRLGVHPKQITKRKLLDGLSEISSAGDLQNLGQQTALIKLPCVPNLPPWTCTSPAP